MNIQLRLPVDLRQKAYTFSLFVYETFEALPERGILVQDIESGVNRLLGKIASYAVSDLKDRLIKDIISEVRGIKVLLGIVRDISLVERYPAIELFTKVTELESIFSDLLHVVTNVEPPAIGEVAPLVGLSPTLASFNSPSLDIGNEPTVTNPGEDYEVSNNMNHAPAEETDRLPESDMDKTADVANASAGESASIESLKDVNSINLEHSFPTKPESQRVDFVASARQEAVMEVLKRRDRVSVGELAKLFSGRVSAKTLQRDLQELIERGRVLRQGDRRWAVYSIIA